MIEFTQTYASLLRGECVLCNKIFFSIPFHNWGFAITIDDKSLKRRDMIASLPVNELLYCSKECKDKT